MKKIFSLLFCFSVLFVCTAQIDSTLFRRIPKDTIQQTLNMDAIYTRPFLAMGKSAISIGGYTEANWQYLVTDGVTEGHQFQARRTTLFIASPVGKRMKFLTEIEFEDGAKEIALEFASLDVELHPLLNLRGGIIMNPIGSFNQNHDGPKWEFVDRPISSTQMLPATWSNAGFGIYGKKYKKQWMFGYEFYLSGSFDQSIVDNEQNKTYLPEAKNNVNRFESIPSGLPLVTGKVSLRHKKAGEIGLSYMGGVYNTFQKDGLILDKKRRVDVGAIDYNVTIEKSNTTIIAEFAWIAIDVPQDALETFGSKQQGGFLDVIQPILKRKMFGWKDATLQLACRVEYVDWNVARFEVTKTKVEESLWSIVPAISFRPSPTSVFRINYRFQEQMDFLANPAVKTGVFQAGFSTYF